MLDDNKIIEELKEIIKALHTLNDILDEHNEENKDSRKV